MSQIILLGADYYYMALTSSTINSLPALPFSVVIFTDAL